VFMPYSSLYGQSDAQQQLVNMIMNCLNLGVYS
jgi:hypothetical protein